MTLKRLATPFILGMFSLTFGFGLVAITTDAHAARAKVSAAELDAAKKAGDLSEEQAEKLRDQYGKEADEYNIEADDAKITKKASGTSTYGVAGFDYLTGVGKVADNPDNINEKTFGIKKANKSPLEDLMKARYKNKWTGQYNDTQSGLGEKSGVTEAWFRKHESGSKLGGDYNEWVNQWNNLTRPGHDKDKGFVTQVAGADPDQGAHWFSFYCVHCHGWTGKGDGPTASKLDPRPRNLTNGKYADNISNIDLFGVIKGGGEFRNLSTSMPPWGNVVQDQDIWNLVAFIRSLSPTYKADKDDITAANADKSAEFKEMNEMLEDAGFMAGRGSTNQLAYGTQRGGFSSIGGGRLASKKVGVSVQKTSGAGTGQMGDWAEDK
ncbi:MAG: c-type cytochrome [Nitrospinae bacterium]|nr:c-type cytochrome [Nitrospinota bacterium]